MREQQYVRIGLRRRRSVIVRTDDAGEVVGVSRIDTHTRNPRQARDHPIVADPAESGWENGLAG